MRKMMWMRLILCLFSIFTITVSVKYLRDEEDRVGSIKMELLSQRAVSLGQHPILPIKKSTIFQNKVTPSKKDLHTSGKRDFIQNIVITTEAPKNVYKMKGNDTRITSPVNIFKGNWSRPFGTTPSLEDIMRMRRLEIEAKTTPKGFNFRPGRHRKIVVITKENENYLKQRLPQAFIIGAGKCGTGTLKHFLAAHPKIVVPTTEEMWFYDNFYHRGPSWQLQYMPYSMPDQLTLENSPSYFHSQIAMLRIIKDNPNGLFLIILRDPIARAISQYIHDLVHPYKYINDTAEGFAQAAIQANGQVNAAWHPIEYGIYSRPLRLWLQKLPLHRLCIIDGSDFAKNPLPHLQRIERYLKIPAYFNESNIAYNEEKGFHCLKYGDGEIECMPQSKGRQHPYIDGNVIDKLRQFFKPHNEELYQMIGQRYKWQ